MNRSRIATPSRWAPWWAYLIPMLALNYLRQVILPPDEVGEAASVALALAIVAAAAALVTAVHRARGQRPARRP
jgi:hypothetical protein